MKKIFLLIITLLFCVPILAQTCNDLAHTNWQGVLNSADGETLFTKININQTELMEVFQGKIGFNIGSKISFPISYENSDCEHYPDIMFVTDLDQGGIIFWGKINDDKMYSCVDYKGKDYLGFLYRF